MRKRRRWYFALSLLAAFIVVAVGFYATRPGINRSGYNRIREGMNLSEVSAVLGKPPGDYRTKQITIPRRRPLSGFLNWIFGIDPVVSPSTQATWWRHDDHRCSSGANWWSDEGMVWVGFSDDGKAVGKHFTE